MIDFEDYLTNPNNLEDYLTNPNNPHRHTEYREYWDEQETEDIEKTPPQYADDDFDIDDIDNDIDADDDFDIDDIDNDIDADDDYNGDDGLDDDDSLDYNSDEYDDDDNDSDDDSLDYDSYGDDDNYSDDGDGTNNFLDNKQSGGSYDTSIPTGAKRQKEKDDLGYASRKYYKSISGDFIIRDKVTESMLGIQDINLYCYWYPEYDNEFVVVGEIAAKKINKKFNIRLDIFDSDGDLIDTNRNSSYTGRSGWSNISVTPAIFFNRYPFKILTTLKRDKLKSYAIKLRLEVWKDDESEDSNDSPSHTPSLNIASELAAETSKPPLYIASLAEGEKLPKDMLSYFTEHYSGITDLKCVFFKEYDSDSVYRANLLSYTTVYSGEIHNEQLIYYLFYNDKDELIAYQVESIEENTYKDQSEKNFLTLPASEKLKKIIIYIAPHPSNF